jgi:hypothetical protein
VRVCAQVFIGVMCLINNNMRILQYQAMSVRNDIKIIDDPNSIIHSFIALKNIGKPMSS